MRLSTIVAKDMLRRKRKVLPAALGVAVGIMTVIATLTVAHAGGERLNGQLEKYGPNLSVLPSTGSLDMSLGGLSLGSVTVGDNYIPETVLPRIQEIADGAIRAEMNITEPGLIATVAPRLYVPAVANGVAVTAAGIAPIEERAIRSWWRVSDGRYLESDDELLAGAFAAATLGIGPGELLTLGSHEFTVAGVLEQSGSNDDYLLFAPLGTVQGVFEKEGLVSTVDVRALCTGCPVEMIADSLSGNIPGIRAVAVRQIAQAEMAMQERIGRLMMSLAAVTLIVGLFGVANAMSAMVAERTKDIGIMRAVGASRRQIVGLFLREAVVLGFLGGVGGYLAGLVLASVLGPLMFDGMTVAPVALYLPLALGLAVAISTLAALRPALVASNMRVADALRT